MDPKTEEKKLYLVNFDLEVVLCPGDDGMVRKPLEPCSRLVRARDEDDAIAVLKRRVEEYREYSVRKTVWHVEVHEVLE